MPLRIRVPRIWVPRPSSAWAGWPVAAIALLTTLASFCPAQDNVVVASPSPNVKPKGQVSFVTGTVYCADTNAPARLAQVFLIPASSDDSGNPSGFMGVADLDGHFAVGNLPEGKYYVAAILSGYLNPMGRNTVAKLASLSPEARKTAESRLITVTVSVKQPAEVSIRLERAAEIDGTILFDDGSPGIGLQVNLEPKPEKGAAAEPGGVFEVFAENQRLMASSDDHGHYRLLGVEAGEYLVSVRVPAFSGERVESLLLSAMLFSSAGALNVYHGDVFRSSHAKLVKIETAGSVASADITIPLSKLHTIRGQIVLKSTGEPPPASGVVLQFADTHELARVGIVAEDGQFALVYVPEGNYLLQAAASPEPLPKISAENGDDIQLTGGFWAFGSNQHDSNQLPGAVTVPLLVTGEISGLTITVPDPQPATTPASPAPSVNPQ